MNITQSLKTHLEGLESCGIDQLRDGCDSPPSITKVTASIPSLPSLKEEVLSCTRCDQLVNCRTHIVFGEGDPNADLVFVGEAPGFEEDKQGRPFVGKAGALLTRMIQAMGLTREQVYICNVLKCRPPENRNPLPTEVNNCSDYLRQQITLVQPKVIVTLGKFASQTLLNSEVSISRLRGKFTTYNGIELMPTFHPAYLLRNENDKKLVWSDLQQVMSRLGLS